MSHSAPTPMMTPEQSYIASVVTTHVFISISMVYLNKTLMSSASVSIPAPLFVTWFQCVVTALICYVCGEVGDRMKKIEYHSVSTNASESDSNNANKNEKGSSKSFWLQFPRAEYHIIQGHRVLPLSLVFVGMITFNNLCLKWVEVSFYNVARSLTLVFNVILSKIMLNIDSSRPTLLCLVVVIVGFFIGSRGEMNFSMKGTVSGILASLFISLNSIYTKKALTVVDNDHWKLTFYNNANACILFIPLMLIFEYQAIGMAFFEQFLSMTFWGAMWIAGFFGFAIGIVTVLQIKATSPLTHHIIGSAKAAIQSILAFYIWGNPATFLGCLGIATVLGGSLLYTYVKMEEGRQPTPPSPPAHADKDVEMNNPLLKGGPN